MAKAVVTIMLVALAVVVVATSAGDAASSGCNISHLTSCKAAVVGGSKPTAACCSSLRAHQPCLCKFQNDPKFGKYVDHPHTLKMVTSCGIPIPNC